jgi:hypothetical protein
MSLDFPRRADWLNYRRRRVNRPHFAFVSAEVGTHKIKLAGGHEMDVPVITKVRTFTAGRNAEKRKARVDQASWRYAQVNNRFHPPKAKLSLLLINMLAERRLRQVGTAA